MTSGTLPVATTRILHPQILVTLERVNKGKPDPEPFILGANELGLNPKDCIVFEDAPSGIRSGNLSGATTVAVLSQFQPEDLPKAHAYISSMKDITVKALGSEFNMVIKNGK